MRALNEMAAPKDMTFEEFEKKFWNKASSLKNELENGDILVYNIRERKMVHISEVSHETDYSEWRN